MIGTLGDVDDYRVQLAIWDSVVSGDVNEFAATVAEGRSTRFTTWDRTAKDLQHEFVGNVGRPWRRVKDWAALPWVTEYLLRGHALWPGL